MHCDVPHEFEHGRIAVAIGSQRDHAVNAAHGDEWSVGAPPLRWAIVRGFS
jgi:hypothetical protein